LRLTRLSTSAGVNRRSTSRGVSRKTRISCILPALPRYPAARAARGVAADREIAQNLLVTARTVEAHLTRACHKLAITSPEQLPAALACADSGPAGPAPASP